MSADKPTATAFAFYRVPPLPRVIWDYPIGKTRYSYLQPAATLTRSGLLLPKDLPKNGTQLRCTMRGDAILMKSGKIRLLVRAERVIARDTCFQRFMASLGLSSASPDGCDSEV